MHFSGRIAPQYASQTLHAKVYIPHVVAFTGADERPVYGRALYCVRKRKEMLRQEEDETLLTQLSAGGLAGGCAAAVTNPLDVVKTRLQLEGVGSATKYRTTAVVRRG